MSYREFREFQVFVGNLTARTSTPWCAVHRMGSDGITVRIDPVEYSRVHRQLRADLILEIPFETELGRAKASVIEKLAAIQ